ncbi:MAG TPA: tungsten formylmethanofuran dehydrogenase, partial [Flavobacteriales bacterium]|nr:tungsten formylmethanofuran dehydrogenase [Flavobacteriales bacterium]
KGLYWSKVKGTEAAKVVEPDEDYILPFGKANIVREADQSEIEKGNSLLIVTYGMGVHWSLNAAKNYQGQVEILDLRTIYPVDEDLIMERSKVHGRILIVTEEPQFNGFSQRIAARISDQCFEYLDAPVKVLGAENMPAIPLNEILEKTMIPSIEKVSDAIGNCLNY